MHVKNVTLKNYRNYDSAQLICHPKLNIIIGNNGQGKTNLVEAIYFSGLGRSFRTTKDQELIKMNQEFSYARIEFGRQYTDLTIEYRLHKKLKKEMKINGVALVKLSELFGEVNIVVFSPEDLRLIKEGPTERRRFIDRELSHISKKYVKDIISYNRILGQRNNLLKKIKEQPQFKETLSVWDEQLCEVGTKIILARIDFIRKLSVISKELHKSITDCKEELTLKYLSNVKINDENYDKIEEEFKSKLNEKTFLDIQRGFTSVGPHRDDLSFYINDIETRVYGSQGQQRTAALSLKLSEIELIKNEVGEYPILILDDVLSELDIHRQKDLVKAIENVQTFITTTDIDEIISDYFKDSKIIEVHNGNFQESLSL